MILRVYFKEILLVLLYAFLQSVIFHFPQVWLLGFVSLVPLFFLLYLCPSAKDALKMGYLAGVLQSAGTYYWLLHVTKVGTVAICVYLGVFTALYAFLAYNSIQVLALAGTPKFRWGWIKIITLSALWVLIEFVRSNVPVMRFPWALLGYSQWKNIPFIQSADLWGAYGISFLLAMTAVGIFAAWMLALRFSRGEIPLARYVGQLILLIGLPLTLLGANVTYGVGAIKGIDASVTPEVPHSRMAVVQGCIPQDQKWDPRIQDMIYRKYDGLSRNVIMDAPDLVIWPETAFPGFWEVEPEMANHVSRLARDMRSELLIGAPTYGESEFGVQKMNSVIHLSKEGGELRRHHKIRLVPFGEYVPFFQFLRRYFATIGHFTPGVKMTLFRTPVSWAFGVTPDARPRAFSTLVCFEDIFPDFCRLYVLKGSSMLINVTNDAWFKDSTGPYQHAQSSVFRAVENRVPVVRAANTGLSCYIDITGRIVDSVKDKGKEIMIAGFETFNVTLNHRLTLYTRAGDWLIVVLLTLFILTHRLYTTQLNTTPSDDID